MHHAPVLLLWMMTALLGAVEILVADHGAVGDGIADDAPALARAMAALHAASPPAVLRFAQGRTYRIASGDGYVIALMQQKQITIDGGGATLLLGADRRGVSLDGCQDMTVRGLRIDYDPLPFAEALVTAVDATTRSLTVQVAKGFALPPAGGPTRSGGEQAYFAMLWNAGPHALRGTHVMVEDLQPGDGRTMRLTPAESFRNFSAITAGVSRISLPVRGVAHRHGAGAVLHLDGNRAVLIEDVEIWSAPWFACTVQRNEGAITLRAVHVRPKPGTSRITSSWRDGMHVKGNRGPLRFEDCILDGTNDDAFNLATFLSRVTAVDGVQVQMRQNFPLGYIPWRRGDTLTAYATTNGSLVGSAQVMEVETIPDPKPDHAPRVTLVLNQALPGLAIGDLAWAVESANPDTVVRRCTIRNSCRFQTPVMVEDCDVAAFLWFYGESIEGPVPSGSLVRGCRLRVGRGNPQLALSCEGWIHGVKPPAVMTAAPALTGLRIEANEIDGMVEIRHAGKVQFKGNRFTSDRARLLINDCRAVVVEGTRLGGVPFPANRLRIEGAGTREEVTVR